MTIMRRYRTSLSVLLGLVLLVQGVAVSAAQCEMFMDKPVPVEMTGAASGMPCHGQAGEASHDTTAATQDTQSCCGDDCPNMASCMLGHLAPGASFQMSTEHQPDALPRLVPACLVVHSPTSLLRPPIALHG